MKWQQEVERDVPKVDGVIEAVQRVLDKMQPF